MTDHTITATEDLSRYCPDWPAAFEQRYRAAGYWRGETFGAMLRERAERLGEHIAIVDGDTRLSYADLDHRADRLAAGLHRLGISKGERVVVQLPNRHEFIVTCFALFRLGALPIFALPAHRQFEIGHFCNFAGAKALITADRVDGFDYRALARSVLAEATTLEHVIVLGDAEEFVSFASLDQEPLDTLPEINSRELAFFQLSGGTTGVPKLIPRRHDDYIYSLRGSVEICRNDTDTVYLGVLPLAHNFPMSSPGFLGVLYAGGRIVIAPRPSPDVCFELIEREHVTMAALVPPLALVWLDAAQTTTRDLSSLEVLQVGGAKLSAEAARRVRPILGCTLQQVFGMAEGLVNYTRLDDPEDVIVRTQGRPISPDDEVRVVDDDDNDLPPGQPGHLLTRGPYTIRGYFNATEHNAKNFTEDGFYRTGDVVMLTENGDLIVEGRDKDQINRGGEKIAAEEVENALLAHESVHDVAVVAMPDKYLGERSCAFVIARGTPPKPHELAQFVRARLASYKVPDRIEFIDAFPQTGVGKVSKKVLREVIRDTYFGAGKKQSTTAKETDTPSNPEAAS
ncbi:(2,3-dihydroxybenzoyl)adenylate synthase [Phytohalomonas tamaricis]|uniref:(2,3-dihydroxybenzoyl)adenylate synthase n=1 Tax=Phytohalomonas tamaricis TaxID=2081032 RepID=UPI000D0BBFC8|nr:(2,3-dihydroxybenzoyl)adenylate synthase [Phytohalomonas tamaricis]